MIKEWYLLIEGEVEGPYSISDLKYDERITKETFAKREQDKKWRPIKEIKELKFLFEEKAADEEEHEESEKIPEGYIQDEIALRYEPEPPISVFLILLILSIAFYVLLRGLLS